MPEFQKCYNMKNAYSARFVPLLLFLVLFILNPNALKAQKGKGTYYPIPEDVNTIFSASCMKCHGEKGGRFPKTKLNFSKWKTYGQSREAEKAALICTVLKKGTMPPKSAREKGSVIIPTKEQVDIICQWAESLKQKDHKIKK
jgi:hypothetical protein